MPLSRKDFFFQKPVAVIGSMFFALTALFFLYTLFLPSPTFFYDSHYYIHIADPLFQNENFSFLHFPETFRGYFFPFVLELLQQVAIFLNLSDSYFYSLLNSVLMSSVITLVLPQLFSQKAQTKRYFISCTLQGLLFLFFWGAYLPLPLSDIPAMAFMLFGVCFLRKASTLQCPSVLLFVYLTLAGFFLYAAYNTRAIYLYGALAAILWFFAMRLYMLIKMYGKAGKKPYSFWAKQAIRPVCSALSLLLGFGILATPQILINHQYTNQISAAVLTQNYDANHSLEQLQVLWGLSLPRYESYVGSTELYPSAGVRFEDDLGNLLLEQEGITAENFSYFDLITLFFKHPLDVASIYTRHLVSGLTPIFSEPYIDDVYQDKTLFVFTGVLCWILAALGFVSTRTKEAKPKAPSTFSKSGLLLLFCLLLPCLFILVGAVEVRFFILLHILLYFYICCKIDYVKLWDFIRKYTISVALICSLFALLWISIVSSLLEGMRYQPLLISSQDLQQGSVGQAFVPISGVHDNGWLEPLAEFFVLSSEDSLVQITGYYPKEITHPLPLIVTINGEDVHTLSIDENWFTFTFSAPANTYVSVFIDSQALSEEALTEGSISTTFYLAEISGI